MLIRSLLLLLLPLVGTSCASLVQSASFEEEARQLSTECVSLHDRIDALTAEREDSCGVACLDMIVRFEGAELPPEVRLELHDHVARERSLSQDRIRDALESAGFLAIHLQGDWHWPGEGDEEASRTWRNPVVHIEQGRPVILRLEGTEGRHHFVLLVGYDPVERRLVVIDPVRGKAVWPESALRSWERADRWFIAYKRPESAVPRAAPGDTEDAAGKGTG